MDATEETVTLTWTEQVTTTAHFIVDADEAAILCDPDHDDWEETADAIVCTFDPADTDTDYSVDVSERSITLD